MLRPDIFKSGWLYKSSSIENRRNWIRGWVVLSRDGSLRFFTSPNSIQAKSIIYLTDSHLTFSSPLNIDLPKTSSISSSQYPILKITTSTTTWLLCAESNDDLLAWQTMFEQIQTNHAQNLVYTNIPNLNIVNERQIVFVVEDENKPYYIKFIDDEGRQQTVFVQHLDNQRQQRELDSARAFFGGLMIWPFCFPIWF